MQNSPGVNTQEKLQNGYQRIMLLVAVSELCTPMRSRKRPSWSLGYISESADSQPRSETAPPSGGSMDGDGEKQLWLESKQNTILLRHLLFMVWYVSFHTFSVLMQKITTTTTTYIILSFDFSLNNIKT